MHQEFSDHFERHVAPIKKIHSDEIAFSEERKDPEKQRGTFFAKPAATSLQYHPIIREGLQTQRALAEQKERDSIKKIFRCGNLKEITSYLQTKESDHAGFAREIARVKKTYEKELGQANFLNEKDWKILAGIELCDKKTFEHSIGTYLIARKKIEERISSLSLEIVDEGVSPDQLYRACLFHDIGKLAIPSFILNNEITANQWVLHFMELSPEEQDDILVENKIVIPDSDRNDLEKMTNFFSKNEIELVKFLPIGTVLSEKQKNELIEFGFSATSTLSEIMQSHEENSKDTLQELGYIIEALLAGNHHGYKFENNEQPTSRTVLHISTIIASNIIRLPDIQNALNVERSYHHKEPMLSILSFLAKESEKGLAENASPRVARLVAIWIADELKKMSPDYLDEIRNMKAKHQHHSYLQKRNEELCLIDEFLADNLPEHE